MAIDPYYTLPRSQRGSLTPGGYTGTSSGAGGMASLLGGAAGGILGMPWSIALPVIMSVLGATGIFGGGDEDEQALQDAMRLKQQMGVLGIPKPYQSPYLPQVDKAVFQALINQMGRTANWGWPAGKGIDTSWLENLMSGFEGGGGGTRIRY